MKIKKAIRKCVKIVGKGLRFVICFFLRLSTLGSKSGKHITRYYMYEHLSWVLKSISNCSTGNKMLSISGSEDICNLVGIKDPQIIEVNFPEYSMLKLPFKDGEFDWVVTGQVLEHVEGNPQQAIDESYRLLKPGGIAIHTTCFIMPIHRSPNDFWRFTPEALQLLCNKFTKILDMGGWGNRYVWFMDWFGLRFFPVPHAKWHPLNRLATINDENWPIVTWIIAQK